MGACCPGSSSEQSVVPSLGCLTASQIHPLPELYIIYKLGTYCIK